MMRKKNLIQNKDLNKTKVESLENRNAKVTVQYIQEQQQLIQKSDNNNHPIMHACAQDDLEIENVEYLEENPNEVEYIEEPIEKDELVDNFYPNAIHCLLDLYKIKYENLNVEDGSFKVFQIWRDIAKDMQESFFEFNECQIQHKYAQLREQYFDVQTKEDIDNFDYFEQLHDIYKDKSKENIVKDLKGSKDSSVYYKDEILLQPEHLEINEDHLHDFKSEEIVHKEHEFIDMVEKELQAMGDGLQIEDNKETATTNDEEMAKKDVKEPMLSNEPIISNDEQILIEQPPNKKRLHSLTETCDEEPPQRKQKLNEFFETNKIKQELPPLSTTQANNDFTLYHYNQQQERRHSEKMSLLEKSLQIQERALEQQHQLLQELIKRLPS
ncbi:uncharacterized protein LOC135959102 [Calliphora vicina]|uniref:uncharacterized protein LOC135959102 n=1 Tax=Calliphora vicina TaxID=7373 RepID=UPI00325A69E4